MELNAANLLEAAKPAAMYYPEGKAPKAKSPKVPKEKKLNMRTFIRTQLAEVSEADPTICRFTYKEIFEAAKVQFPEWNSLGRAHYPQWYYLEALRKGEKLPLPNKPAKEPKAAKEPTKAVKDMTPDEKSAHIKARNKDLKAKGMALLPEDPSMPIPTVAKGTAHGKVYRKK